MSESHSEKIQVWLVEDNEVFRRNVQRVINSLEGMTCEGSFDSAEATFKALQTNPAPDVILLMFNFPESMALQPLPSSEKPFLRPG